jgi:toxin ParE1/3/4
VFLEWTEAAEVDAGAILAFIAQDSIAAAYDVYEEIREQARHLVEYPDLGRVGRLKGTRELVINRTPYIMVYRIKGERVELLRVLHGAQQWP